MADEPQSRSAQLVAFGTEPADARVVALERSTAWRAGGTAARLGATAVITPLVALLPPHAPWVAGALIGGVLLARRRWTERWTLMEFEGTCPKCEASIALKPGTRLLSPQPVTCESCHQSMMLEHGAPAPA